MNYDVGNTNYQPGAGDRSFYPLLPTFGTGKQKRQAGFGFFGIIAVF